MHFQVARFIALFSAAFIAVMTTSCSNDDDRSDIPENRQAPPINHISFTVSGAENGEKTGECRAFMNEVLGEYFLDISGNDGVEESDSEMTFNIAFSYSGTTPVAAGTYPIDYDAYLAGEGFFVSYDAIDEPNSFFELFGSTFPQEGAIAITAVTETSITGTFAFSASNQAGNREVVVAEGQFNALSEN